MVPLRLRRFPIAGKKYIAPFLLCFCLFALPTFLLAQDEQAAPGTRMTRLTTRHILISPSEAEGLLLQKTAPVYPPAAKAAREASQKATKAAAKAKKAAPAAE